MKPHGQNVVSKCVVLCILLFFLFSCSQVSGHNDYNTKLPDILAAVGLKVHPQSESGDEDDTTATAGSVVTEEEDGFTVVSQLDDAGEGKDLRHPECPVPLVELVSCSLVCTV